MVLGFFAMIVIFYANAKNSAFDIEMFKKNTVSVFFLLLIYHNTDRHYFAIKCSDVNGNRGKKEKK